MKKTIVFLVLLLVAGLAFGQDQYKKDPYKKVKNFGTASLRWGGVNSEQELIDLLNQEQEAIAIIFGHNDVLIKIFIQHMSGDIEIQSRWFEAGSKFLSMTYRWNGKVMDTGKWEWVGKEPFKAFVVVVEQVFDDFIRQYWLVVPEKCGNIALMEIKDIKIETIEKKQIIPQKEEREITRFPSRLSLKSDTITSTTQEQKPKPVAEQPKQPAQINFFAGAGVGGFYSCFMEYGTVEVGMRRRISGSVAVLASIGVGMPVGQNKHGWYTVPMVNFDLVGTLFEPVYLGAGIGFSGKMKEGQESQLEFGPTVGFRMGGVDFSFRGRVPFKGDPRGIKGNYKILLGIKMFF